KWYIDDVEQVDLVNFDGQACVTYQGGSPACARAPERGVIVNRGTSATDDPSQPTLPIHVQPNPASDLLNITLGEAASGAVQVTLLSAEGRQVATLQREQYATAQVLSMDVSRVPAGMYWVRVQTASGVGVEKVVVKR
ncbi:MAG TPA: T9SS type A sorting domain-containing protein, partial [Saprospiraceae bacterium]|nr:T9SS type A sorting domain-containing protein [Saprospiraceae bacterium]